MHAGKALEKSFIEVYKNVDSKIDTISSDIKSITVYFRIAKKLSLICHQKFLVLPAVYEPYRIFC